MPTPAAAGGGGRMSEVLMTVAKGGKNWRRSIRQSVLNNAASKRTIEAAPITARRAPGARKPQFHPRLPPPLFNGSLDLFDENDEIDEEEAEEDMEDPAADPIPEAFRKTFCHSHRSSSFIVPPDGESEEDEEVEKEKSAMDRLIERTDSKQVVDFGGLYSDSDLARKVGEGSFGEVFLLVSGAVLKVIPVDGSALVNGQAQTKMDDILAEIIASVELSRLR